MKRKEKEEFVGKLQAEFGEAQHAILVDFRGLTVPAATEFRQRIRQSGSRYKVVKNTLARRAVVGTPLEGLGSGFEETTGIAYTGDDPVALAKALVGFAKEHPALKVKAGLVAGSQVLDADGVTALSAMPGLSELRASFLGLLMAPATRLVRVLNAPGSQLAQVLEAHRKKLEEGGGQAA